MSYQSDKIAVLRAACDANQLSSKDISFGASLCDQFLTKNHLSDKQWYWVDELIKRAGATPATKSESKPEEIFEGRLYHDLLRKASKKLKRPQLRYQADGGRKIVFSYVADNTSKWYNCVFIDNGAKGENKVRYGFITRNGQGNLNTSAPQEVKTFIRKTAIDPIAAAKLSGQAFKNCVFCGLELVNKSSVYHGYGPICAENWGLPWGDTGDPKDEEEAAAAELKHIQLVDIGGS